MTPFDSLPNPSAEELHSDFQLKAIFPSLPKKLVPEDNKQLEAIEKVVKSHLLSFNIKPKDPLRDKNFDLSEVEKIKPAFLQMSATKQIWKTIFEQKTLSLPDKEKITRLIKEIIEIANTTKDFSKNENRHAIDFVSNEEEKTKAKEKVGSLFCEIISILNANEKTIYREVVKLAVKNPKTRESVLKTIETLSKCNRAPFSLISKEQGFPDFNESNQSPEVILEMVVSEKGQSFIFTLLAEIMVTSPEDVIEILKEFKIDYSIETGFNTLIKIIEAIALSSPELISDSLKLFGVIDQKTIIDIAKLVSQQYPYATSNYKKAFGIEGTTPEGQTGLIEIAKILARANGGIINQNIKNYGINDQKALNEIALIAFVESQYPSTDYNISSFGEVDQKTKIKIVREMTLKESISSLLLINHFNIDRSTEEGQAFVMEMALLTASSYPGVITGNIKKYKIDAKTEKGQAVLVQIAKIEANSSLELAAKINDFEISNPNELIQIAKIIAFKNVETLLQNLGNFGIDPKTLEGQKALIDIAKYVAAQPSTSICFFIKDYPVKDKKALIEIAMIAAKDPKSKISIKIQNFGIKDQKALVEIAKVASSSNSGEFAENFRLYGIEDQSAMIELAFILAEQDEEVTSQFIKDSEIDINTVQGQKGVVDTAQIIVRKNGLRALYQIRHFGIHEVKDKLLIYANALLFCSPEEMKGTGLPLIFSYDDFNKAKNEYSALLFLDTDFTYTEKNRKFYEANFRESITRILKEHPLSLQDSAFEGTIDIICAQQNLQIQSRLYLCFISLLLSCQVIGLNGNQLLKIKPLIDILLQLRNPSLRSALLFQLNRFMGDADFIASWLQLFEKTGQRKSAALPCLLLTPFIGLIGQEFFEKNMVPMLKHAFFKDSSRLNSLLTSLNTLCVTPNLSLEIKTRLLKNCVFTQHSTPAQVLKNFQQIYYLIIFRQFESLKMADNPRAIEEGLNELFTAELGIAHLPEFGQKFLATFAGFRQPDAIFKYVATLKGLPIQEQKPVVNLLKDYATSVLEGTFHQKRYDVNHSPHLQEVFKERAILEKEWKEGAVFSIETLMAEISSEIPPQHDFKQFFINKILFDEHFPKKFVPYLLEVLNHPEQKEIQLEVIKKELIQLKDILKQSNEGLNKESKKEVLQQIKLLGIQQIALELLAEELTQNESLVKISKLSSLIGEVSKTTNDSYEFLNDLKGLQEVLQLPKAVRSEEKMVKWKVIDSDDPCDLLLLGTEIAGSCQRVDGDSMYNKCLVAYLMDGKNRALVIKDETGKIVARSVLRLLIDSKTKQPVLFQERVYPDMLDPSLLKILNKACLERAKQLELPLYSTEANGKYSKVSIASLGGCAPYEYVDAAGGIRKNGVFEISNAIQVA